MDVTFVFNLIFTPTFLIISISLSKIFLESLKLGIPYLSIPPGFSFDSKTVTLCPHFER